MTGDSKGFRLVALILQSFFILSSLFTRFPFYLCVWCEKICYFRLCSIVAFLCYVRFLYSLYSVIVSGRTRTNFAVKALHTRSSLLIILLIETFDPVKFLAGFVDAMENSYNLIWFALKAERVKRQLILWYTFYSSNWFTARSRQNITPQLGNIFPTSKQLDFLYAIIEGSVRSLYTFNSM